MMKWCAALAAGWGCFVHVCRAWMARAPSDVRERAVPVTAMWLEERPESCCWCDAPHTIPPGQDPWGHPRPATHCAVCGLEGFITDARARDRVREWRRANVARASWGG